MRADQLTAGLPKRSWQRLSAGTGAKGQRYDWALITHPDPAGRGGPIDVAVLVVSVRRHRDTGELVFYRCYAPEMVGLDEDQLSTH